MQPTQNTPQTTDTLSILAIVFAFLPLQVVGITLAAISLHKSKVTGQKNTLALVGLILNIVTLAIFVALTSLFFARTIPAIVEGNQITQGEQTTSTTAYKNAKQVELTLTSYFVDNEQYPSRTTQLSTVKDNPLPSGVTISAINPTAANANTVIGYQYVQGAVTPAVGGRIGYWDTSSDKLLFIYVGNAAAGDRFVAPKS